MRKEFKHNLVVPTCSPHKNLLTRHSEIYFLIMTLGTLLTRAFTRFKHTNIKPPEMDNYVWIDLEMTGLEVENHTILEAACIVTTTDLKPLHEGLRLVIHQPEDVLESMNYWSRIQHAKSGLTFESRESKLSLAEADNMLADYIAKHANQGGVRYLAGNSVYVDKRFLEKYMPNSDKLLHYRIVDVSTLKVLCSHMYADEFSKMPKKKLAHRALDDILESIEELKGLGKIMFK